MGINSRHNHEILMMPNKISIGKYSCIGPNCVILGGVEIEHSVEILSKTVLTPSIWVQANTKIGGIVPKSVSNFESQLEKTMLRECVLENDFYNPPLESLDNSKPEVSTILITGATGFLGRFLLKELLIHTNLDIVCLVRGNNSSSRLFQILSDSGITLSESEKSRVQTVSGDVGIPFLGMSDSDYSSMSSKVDIVLHSAAILSYLRPYNVLKTINVTGVKNVLQFCGSGRQKTLHYISTIGAVTPDMMDENGIVMETASASDKYRFPFFVSNSAYGYFRSKWVAEKMVRNAAAHGQRVLIYRPGEIGCSSQTGFCTDQDLSEMMKFISQKLVYPHELHWNLSPVDFVATLIAQIVKKDLEEPFPCDGVNTIPCFHAICDDNSFSFDEVAEILKEFGIVAKPLSFHKWISTVKEKERGLIGVFSFLNDQIGDIEYFMDKSEAKKAAPGVSFQVDIPDVLHKLIQSTLKQDIQ
jgi:thioester reductase-like protein